MCGSGGQAPQSAQVSLAVNLFFLHLEGRVVLAVKTGGAEEDGGCRRRPRWGPRGGRLLLDVCDGQRKPFLLLASGGRRGRRGRRRGLGLERLLRGGGPLQLSAVAALVAQEAIGAREAPRAVRARVRGRTARVDLRVAGQVGQPLELPLAAHALEGPRPRVGYPVLPQVRTAPETFAALGAPESGLPGGGPGRGGIPSVLPAFSTLRGAPTLCPFAPLGPLP